MTVKVGVARAWEKSHMKSHFKQILKALRNDVLRKHEVHVESMRKA